jgi:hypothetical protein
VVPGIWSKFVKGVVAVMYLVYDGSGSLGLPVVPSRRNRRQQDHGAQEVQLWDDWLDVDPEIRFGM